MTTPQIEHARDRHRKAPEGAKAPNIAYYMTTVREAQHAAHVATQNLDTAINQLAARMLDHDRP